jgi:hypothetical protein
MVISKLLAAISQEVSFGAAGGDLEELEQRYLTPLLTLCVDM